MENRLYLRYKCTLLLEERVPSSIIVHESVENYVFSVSKSGQNIKMKLLQDGKTIEAESVVDYFKPNSLQILRTNDHNKLSEEEKTELSDLTHPIREAVRQFAGLLKQELHRYDLKDELIGNPYCEWSLGGNQWFSIPRGLRMDVEVTSLGNLDERLARHLQELLLEDEEAIIATNYLHQARNSMNRRYRWIYATMAAELAIKEILVRIEPKLQVILEELPSPPLGKLYGDVLQSVASIRLTKSDLEELQKGARRRNKLVHNPKSTTPTFNEAKDYIDFIENKVKWLLKEWRRIKQEKGEVRPLR